MLNEWEECRRYCMDWNPSENDVWKKRRDAFRYGIKHDFTGISRPMTLIARRFLFDPVLYRKTPSWEERIQTARLALFCWSGFSQKDAEKDTGSLTDVIQGLLSAKGQELIDALTNWFPQELQQIEKESSGKKTCLQEWEKKRNAYAELYTVPDVISVLASEPCRVSEKRFPYLFELEAQQFNRQTFERIISSASDLGPLRNRVMVIGEDFRWALSSAGDNGKTYPLYDRYGKVTSNYGKRSIQIFHLLAAYLCARENSQSPYVPITLADFGVWYGNARTDKYFKDLVEKTMWSSTEGNRNLFRLQTMETGRKYLWIDPEFIRTYRIYLLDRSPDIRLKDAYLVCDDETLQDEKTLLHIQPPDD